MPLIARIAAAVAFLVTAGSLLPALRGQIFALPFALVPLFAGVGILRRRAWSAWGLALYTLAQLVPLAIVLSRSNSMATRPPGSLGAVMLAVLLVPLFFFTGRSLAEAAAPRGRAWPWIAVSALTTMPLLFFQIFVIPSAAMENTLLAGDRVVVWRYPKHTPARDEMAVFRYPIDKRQTFMQRVAGIPGDRIRISRGVLYRNGIAISEPWAVRRESLADPYRDDFPHTPTTTMYHAQAEMLRKDVVDGEVIVPAGEYFMLGDNRDYALDSRYWGFASQSDVIGKPVLIYGSEQDEGNGRTRVRWDRLFRIL